MVYFITMGKQKTAKEIIDHIEKLWYGKQLSDTKGFREEVPKFQTKKIFREIHVWKQDGTRDIFILDVKTFKEYKALKIKMLGLDA